MDLIDYATKEEIEKKYITLIYEDKETRVSWFADTEIDDVRFAIICACDSLADGEFEVLDDRAKAIDVNTMSVFKNGQVLFLKKKQSNKPTKILLDGKRKLQIQIEPLRHIEAQIAVKYIIVGSNLLKHTNNGYPHIRQFQLSSDLKRILWYTKSKKINESQVSFDSITNIVLGQKSDAFLRYPLKMLEDFSFSIYYKNSFKNNKITTLDITCKDQREFDLWIIAIRALLTHHDGKIINKNDLMSHSKSYKEQVEKGNVGHCSIYLIYDNLTSLSSNNNNYNNYHTHSVENLDNDNKEAINKDMIVTTNYSQIGGIEGGINKTNEKSLEKFLVCRNLSYLDISKLFLKLCEKIKTLKKDIEDINSEEKLNDRSGKKLLEGYEVLCDEETIVDDLETQKYQMSKIYADGEKNLGILLQQYIWFCKENKLVNNFHLNEEDFDDFHKNIYNLENQLYFLSKNEFDPSKINLDYFMKELDIQLWKIEIDLENVNDIIFRIKVPQDEGIIAKIKGLWKYFKY